MGRKVKQISLDNCIDHVIRYIENDYLDISIQIVRTVLTKWVMEIAPRIRRGKKYNLAKILLGYFPNIDPWKIEAIVEAKQDYLQFVGMIQGKSIISK